MKRDEVRVETLVELLDRKKLDALLFIHPENVLLSSGMLPAASFTVCMITACGRVIVITPWWRKESVQINSWADRIFTFNWLKSLRTVNPVVSLNTCLVQIRRKLKINSIGYDGSFECFMPSYTPSTFFSYRGFKVGLGEIFDKAIDISQDIQQVRAIKTVYEIKMLKRASSVSEEAARVFYESAKPGVREIDIAAEILRVVQTQAGKNGIKFTYCDPPQITSGSERTLYANVPVCPSTTKKLKKGELVMLELGGCADGYWFDLTRTLVVGGRAKTVHNEMVAAIKDAMKAAYSAFSQNRRTGAELTEAAFKVLKSSGFAKAIVHGIGHGMGFAYHENQPNIGLGSKDVIRPGMVTSMEPGLYLPGVGGIRIEENVLWGENKVTVLSSYYNGLNGWPIK